MADGKTRVDVDTSESDAEIKRAEDEMVSNARGMQRSSGFWSRGFAPEMYEGYKRDMTEAAKRGLEARRGRARAQELGKKLSDVMNAPSKPAAKKRAKKRS